jgi:hypothetical protein
VRRCRRAVDRRRAAGARSLVLTIDPAYFALTDGIERWLYRVARRHAGHQPKGWAFELRHLHAKSGSAARSPILPSISVASPPVRACRATTCLSNWRKHANCCGSSHAGYPQAL